MKILITNDDGIFAKGIKVLAKALSKVEGAEVYVCAPDKERSCIGHGLTVFDELELKDFPADGFEGPVKWARSCSGTPADCVRLALYVLTEQGIKIDLVCSGVNNGGNLGTDTNYSGTIAACREAVIDGCPAIGFSTLHHGEFMDNFLEFVPDIVDRFYGKIPPLHILNFNAPNTPMEEIKGMKSAGLAHVCYPTEYALTGSENGTARYSFASYNVTFPTEIPGSDRTVVEDGYAAVTLIPLIPDTSSTTALVEELLR